MTKYKVYLKSGSVLEVEADNFEISSAFLSFFVTGRIVGSFPVAEIFGFCASDKVTHVSGIRGINQP
jgi:hypothetical protein